MLESPAKIEHTEGCMKPIGAILLPAVDCHRCDGANALRGDAEQTGEGLVRQRLGRPESRSRHGVGAFCGVKRLSWPLACARKCRCTEADGRAAETDCDIVRRNES